MNLFENMLKHPLLTYGYMLVVGAILVSAVEAVMYPVAVYTKTLAEKKAEQTKSD